MYYICFCVGTNFRVDFFLSLLCMQMVGNTQMNDEYECINKYT